MIYFTGNVLSWVPMGTWVSSPSQDERPGCQGRPGSHWGSRFPLTVYKVRLIGIWFSRLLFNFVWFFFVCFLIFLFFSFIYISWRLITLQYYSGFCHTLIWISHGFTCVPHPEPPSYLPPHPIPLGHPGAPALSTCLMHQTWTGDLFHNW